MLKIFIYFAGFNYKKQKYEQKINRVSQRWLGVVVLKMLRTMCFTMTLGLKRMF